jgi:hypothetical protein
MNMHYSMMDSTTSILFLILLFSSACTLLYYLAVVFAIVPWLEKRRAPTDGQLLAWNQRKTTIVNGNWINRTALMIAFSGAFVIYYFWQGSR